MQEISNNEIKLLAENNFVRHEIEIKNNQLESTRRYLIGVSIALYIVLTVAAAAIIHVHNQDEIIVNQDNTISEIMTQLLTTQLSLNELKSDNKMLEELGK